MKKSCVDQEYFFRLAEKTLVGVSPAECVSLDLIAEESTFLRFNSGKVRQAGEVEDALLRIRYVDFSKGDSSGRAAQMEFTLSALLDEDVGEAKRALSLLREEVKSLPVDPFAQRLPGPKESCLEATMVLPAAPEAVEQISRSARGLEFTGIFSAAKMKRGLVNSAGAKHWYAKQNFLLDYSLHGEGEKALKGYFSRNVWSEKGLSEEFDRARENFSLLQAPPLTIPRGAHRTYLAPAATAEILDKISTAASEMEIRQGDSPLRRLRSGEVSLSKKFSLWEDFSAGDAPRFDSMGGLSPEKICLVAEGKLKETLISPRTAKEFGLSSNGASQSESASCPRMLPGNLAQDQAVKALGEGLYLSNLHYLNWSDQPEGRITGMTRYACFWVEDGRLKAPIQNLRWDDSVFRLFGSELEELTDTPHGFPNTSSYEFRGLGAISCPGMLLKSMQFTL